MHEKCSLRTFGNVTAIRVCKRSPRVRLNKDRKSSITVREGKCFNNKAKQRKKNVRKHILKKKPPRGQIKEKQAKNVASVKGK